MAIFLFLSLLQKAFFNVLIGWKGLGLGSLSGMFIKFSNLVGQLTVTLHIPIILVEIALYPFLFLYKIADFADVDTFYQLLTVTCQGAKAPIELFIDSFVLGVAVLFIKSNYSILWSLTLQEMNKSIAVKYWIEDKKIISYHFALSIIALIFTGTNPFISVLRFFLSFVNFGAFFTENNVSHNISPACVGIKGFENQELWLVDATSVLIWWLIAPMIYMTSEIVCPKGGFTQTLFCKSRRRKRAVVTPLSPDNLQEHNGYDSDSVNYSEDGSSVSSFSQIENEKKHESTLLAVSGFSRYVSFHITSLLPSDLFVVYIINAWVLHCEKINRLEHLRQRRSHHRWTVQVVEKSILRFQAKQKQSSGWNGYVKYFIDYEMAAREIDELSKKKWDIFSHLPELPSFFRLCCREQKELEGRLKRSNIIFRLLSLPISTLIALSGLGHLFTRIGRKYWAIVIRKYLLFTFACMGIWTDEIYEAYEVEELLKKFTYNDPEEVAINLIPIIIASRVILLQALGGTTTLISIVVLNLCSSPILVFSPKMLENIPPLIHLNPREVALKRERTEQLGLHHDEHKDKQIEVEEWVINVWALSIFLTESRLMVFFANLVSLIMAIIILKNVSVSSFYLILLLLCILPYFVGSALLPIMYLGKRLKLRDEDFRLAHLGWLLQGFHFRVEDEGGQQNDEQEDGPTRLEYECRISVDESDDDDTSGRSGSQAEKEDDESTDDSSELYLSVGSEISSLASNHSQERNRDHLDSGFCDDRVAFGLSDGEADELEEKSISSGILDELRIESMGEKKSLKIEPYLADNILLSAETNEMSSVRENQNVLIANTLSRREVKYDEPSTGLQQQQQVPLNITAISVDFDSSIIKESERTDGQYNTETARNRGYTYSFGGSTVNVSSESDYDLDDDDEPAPSNAMISPPINESKAELPLDARNSDDSSVNASLVSDFDPDDDSLYAEGK